MNSWRETIEQCKPRHERTQPHPLKRWKSTAKKIWRRRAGGSTDVRLLWEIEGQSYDLLLEELERRRVWRGAPLGEKFCRVRILLEPEGRRLINDIGRPSKGWRRLP
jgi:hypothetical protein